MYAKYERTPDLTFGFNFECYLGGPQPYKTLDGMIAESVRAVGAAVIDVHGDPEVDSSKYLYNHRLMARRRRYLSEYITSFSGLKMRRKQVVNITSVAERVVDMLIDENDPFAQCVIQLCTEYGSRAFGHSTTEISNGIVMYSRWQEFSSELKTVTDKWRQQ